MNTDDLIAFARKQIEAAHEKPTWEAIARFWAELYARYLQDGYRLKAEHVDALMGEQRPVVGSARTDIDPDTQ